MKSTFSKTNRSCLLLATVGLACSGLASVQANGPWEEVRKLLATDGNFEDSFGFATALNETGTMAVIGAPSDDDLGDSSGSAFVFDVVTGEQLFKLLADDGGESDNFGRSVAVSGDRAVIGAMTDADHGQYAGSAYVFNITTGQQLLKIFPDDAAPDQRFGNAVAVHGNIAVIGAYRDSDNGKDAGAAYVFNIVTGEQLFKLLPGGGAPGDNFGQAVALNRDSDNGEDSGTVYLFDLTTGELLTRLLPMGGMPDDLFGMAVAVEGDFAVCTAVGDSASGLYAGAAYVFDISTGGQLVKLLASDGASEDFFGMSVAVSDGRALIGAIYDDDQGEYSGSAYVFAIPSGTQLDKLTASDGASLEAFGYSVALSQTTVLIGVPGDSDNGENSGSAIVFFPPINVLQVTPDPLIGGEKALFAITEANPKANTWLLYSLNGIRPTFIPQLNITIDLSRPKVAAGPKRTDVEGALEFALPMPHLPVPLNVWFQAVQMENITNYVATYIEP